MNKATKKLIIAIAMASTFALSLTGCGGSTSSSTNTTTPAATTKATDEEEPEFLLTAYEEKVTHNDTEATEATEIIVEAEPQETEAETVSETVDTAEAEVKTEAEESEDELSLVPACSFPIPEGMDFSKVTVNGVEVDVSNITLGDFLTQTGLTRNPVGTTSLSSKYIFESGMYGIRDEGKSNEYGYDFMDGTQLSIEVIDENGEIVFYNDVEEEELNNCRIKGFHISEFWLKDDFDVVFCGGIKPLMPKDDFISLMGEGERLGDNRVYSNENFTLIVETGVEDGNWIVDEVTLFIN